MGIAVPLKTKNGKRGRHTLVQISVSCALGNTKERLCEEEKGLRRACAVARQAGECGKCRMEKRSVEREFESTPPRVFFS